jgi:hypothetical protein
VLAVAVEATSGAVIQCADAVKGATSSYDTKVRKVNKHSEGAVRDSGGRGNLSLPWGDRNLFTGGHTHHRARTLQDGNVQPSKYRGWGIPNLTPGMGDSVLLVDPHNVSAPHNDAVCIYLFDIMPWIALCVSIVMYPWLCYLIILIYQLWPMPFAIPAVCKCIFPFIIQR